MRTVAFRLPKPQPKRMDWRDLAHTTVSMTVIVAVRYLVVAGAIYGILWRRNPQAGVRRLSRRAPSSAQVRGEIGLSLLSSVIYAAPSALALEAWKHGHTKLYSDLSPAAWPGMALAAVAYLLIQDAHYYWLHRLMHWRPLFRWLHAGHHRHPEPSPFAGFAFDPSEAALTGWLLPALAFVIPMEIHLAVGLLMLITVTGVLNHAGWEVWPRRVVEGPMGKTLITASHHAQHHGKFGCNYGLHLQLWDRLMRTNAEGAAHPAWRR